MWIEAKTRKDGGCTVAEIIRHGELEISELGATTRTVKNYLHALIRHGLVQEKGRKIICTQTGKNWLEKKVS